MNRDRSKPRDMIVGQPVLLAIDVQQGNFLPSPATSRLPLMPDRADRMRRVFFVVVAVVIEQLRIRDDSLFQRDGPRARVRLLIVDRDIHLKPAERHAPKPLDDNRRVGHGTAVPIETRPITQTPGFDDELIAFPSAD